MFRLGCGDANTPQFGERMFETRTMQRIREIQSRAANEELVQLYFLAINRKNEGEESDPKVPAHKVGDILYEYFLGEGQAILYLAKVSVRALVRLTHQQRQIMLQEKEPDGLFVRGPDFKWKDDMWWCIYEMCQSSDFYAPLGEACPRLGTKRARDPELCDPPFGSVGKRVRSLYYQI